MKATLQRIGLLFLLPPMLVADIFDTPANRARWRREWRKLWDDCPLKWI